MRDSVEMPAGFRFHGATKLRGSERVPHSSTTDGRFGRMFRRLSPMPELDRALLEELASRMVDGDAPAGGWGGTPTGGDNPAIPAGYTYFGQFMDHDVTFDPISSLQRQNDLDALHDFRTPRYDLDSLYGSGPADEPFQYEPGTEGMRFLIEMNANRVEDLPRNSREVALIGDPRNDENTIVSQLQLAFLKLHNKLGADVAVNELVPVETKFEETQRLVRWHYQWVVSHDYVHRVIGDEMFKRLWTVDQDGRPEIRTRFYKPRTKPYMPVEFSVAAFRFGHSMIRGIYNLSSQVTDRPIFIPGPLPDKFADLRGFRMLPEGWTVDWTGFFDIGGSNPQPSRLIDSHLVRALHELPTVSDGPRSLAFRNLLRGQALGLPSGQDVAKYLGVPRVFSGAEMGAPDPTPLWFYILLESELTDGVNGTHLGPVGGRIVGEVLLGMLEGDPQSWYSVDRGWKPTIPDQDGDGEISVGDLVRFATT
jgi:hypothetical protein